MPTGESTETLTDSISLHREKARLRWIGVIVLVVGFSCAGIVYWIGNRSEDARLDQYKQAQARAETRQMQMLYGTSGGLMEDFLNALKRPDNQALGIGIITGLVAAGCFYLGRPFPKAEETR